MPSPSLSLALFQPDIPQNVGAAIRLCACLGVGLHIIEPCGFPWDEKKIRTAAMDYMDSFPMQRHSSWDSFKKSQAGRLILLTTKTQTPYTAFSYRFGDILLLGRESAGVPLDIHQGIHEQVTIPMIAGQRSLNVINAAAMVLGEGLRQTQWRQ